MQKLKERTLKNTPTGISHARCNCGLSLNSPLEVIGSVADLKTSFNNSDAILTVRGQAGQNLRVSVVYVLNQSGLPLMPCRPQKARRLLEQGLAKIVKRTPFTIQLSYPTGEVKQEVVFGMDSGFNKEIGNYRTLNFDLPQFLGRWENEKKYNFYLFIINFINTMSIADKNKWIILSPKMFNTFNELELINIINKDYKSGTITKVGLFKHTGIKVFIDNENETKKSELLINIDKNAVDTTNNIYLEYSNNSFEITDGKIDFYYTIPLLGEFDNFSYVSVNLKD